MHTSDAPMTRRLSTEDFSHRSPLAQLAPAAATVKNKREKNRFCKDPFKTSSSFHAPVPLVSLALCRDDLVYLPTSHLPKTASLPPENHDRPPIMTRPPSPGATSSRPFDPQNHRDEDSSSSTIARITSSNSSFVESCSSSTKHYRAHRSRRAATATATASALRSLSFVASVVSALCAGSITVFSLYGHIFQERLHYTQLQVNGLAISSSIALYLPVSALGYLCDRAGARPLSFLAALLFGTGYVTAATTYRKLDLETAAGLRGRDGRIIRIVIGDGDGDGGGSGSGAPYATDWTYPIMMFAFVCVGVGTCAMYLAAVATNAKNFGKGRHRGLALAVPIAAFGLSGMWLSQLGSRVFYERLPDGKAGDLDVFAFFLFLALLLVVVGVLGGFALRVVDEADMIEEAVEELERSGLLDRSALLEGGARLAGRQGYGAVEDARGVEGVADDDDDGGGGGGGGTNEEDDDGHDDEDDVRRKKEWVLNAETRRFLTDRTMWFLALGFLLLIGPGEAFINNLGTIIGTLYPPARDRDAAADSAPPTSPSTHVSIVALTSTAARLLTGSLTDLLAPSPATRHLQVHVTARPPFFRNLSISRVAFLLAFGATLSLGLLVLAAGAAQGHGERFWIVSGLVGAGYGAVFSLTPIIITVIWGVENFATNWGIVAMFPALGATFWGLVYSAVYQAGARHPPPGVGGGGDGEEAGDVFCYGRQCYAPTFWAMAATVWLACLMILYAWKGHRGWSQRGIIV
ncbi:MFS general substrate transporter [Sodiomyces alkalinus F11]|uniref:Probable transporter MCH1 n=1 Tax=Sodiomyces alkalinus (strain CBS 110278 / VKM F-3762 / F11) TaxID=1314773 RepID=A0A3N2PKQ4_SODAK|nr:MFS general substrate transporter [Sodiomyces alkalinus F11]ROT35108.1 MFS general substrate transporter [Sodiomyces alkalinus F11]